MKFSEYLFIEELLREVILESFLVEVSDEEKEAMVRQAQSSDPREKEQGIERILQTYKRAIEVAARARATRSSSHIGDFEDIAQDARVGLWRSIDSLKDPRTLKGFIMNIIANKAVDMGRAGLVTGRDATRASKIGRGMEEPEGDVMSMLSTHGETPQKAIERRELIQKVHKALQQLGIEKGGRYQEVLTGHMLGKRNTEMAQEMGISDSIIRRTLSDAKKHFFQILQSIAGEYA